MKNSRAIEIDDDNLDRFHKDSKKSRVKLFDLVVLKKAVLKLRAINHPLRRQMMEIIKAEGKITVTELFIKLRLEQSVV